MKYNLQMFTSKVEKLGLFIGVEVISNDLLKKQNEWMFDEKSRYIYSILFKTINGLSSANLLFSNLHSRAHYVDSAFIVLRTLLSDNIIFLYLLLKSEGDDEKLSLHIKSLYFDHIRQEIINLEKIYRQGYKMSYKEYDERLREIKNAYKEYFDEDGEPLYTSIVASVSKAVQYAIQFKDKVNPDFLMSAFEHYNLFSKYEHFGEYTFTLTHRQYSKTSFDQLFLEYFEAINLLMRFISSHLKAWYKNDTSQYQTFKIFEEEIGNLNAYLQSN